MSDPLSSFANEESDDEFNVEVEAQNEKTVLEDQIPASKADAEPANDEGVTSSQDNKELQGEEQVNNLKLMVFSNLNSMYARMCIDGFICVCVCVYIYIYIYIYI